MSSQPKPSPLAASRRRLAPRGLARGLAFLAVALFAWAALGVAVAASPTDDEKRRAGTLFMEGQALFEQGLYAAAIEKFQAAHAIIEHEVNLFNIARSFERAGGARECINYFEQYLEFFRKKHGSDPEDVRSVRAAIQGCRLLLSPEVSVGSDPPGARIYIDDEEKLLGQTPYETTLAPGTYTLYLDLAGHVPFRETFEVRAGQPLKLFFKLERLRRVGTVAVTSNIRGATIFVDGRNIGLTPYTEPLVLEEGTRQITVQKDEYRSFSREVRVAVSEEYTVHSELFLRDPPMTWKGYLGYTTLVLGAGGVGFGVFAMTQANRYFAGTSDFERWEMLQNVGYGAGGGLMGLGVLLLILEALDTEIIKPGDAIGAATTPAGGAIVSPFAGPVPGGGMVGADVRF